MRRVPLWLTLLPLIAGIGLYWYLWSGWARGFEAALRPWLPGVPISATGFPYRLEAEVTNPRIALGDAVKLTASADLARINRGPWRPELTLVSATKPQFAAAVSPLLSAALAGSTGQVSIKVENQRLTRLSAVVTAATARLGFIPVAVTADSLELHLRELGPVAATLSAAPTPPARGQLVIAGERLRLDGGDALTLAADLTATGPARLTNYDTWASSGTLEVTSLTLADAHGEIASAKATLVPRGRLGLRFAGTISTVCPLGIKAAFDGQPAPPEKRLRIPVRLAFSGVPGAMLLEGLPANLATRPVKAQMPACPVVRGQAR
jgi:hypothetical protein